MPTYNVIFAYNSTDAIPAAGAQRKTYNVAFANANRSIAESEREEDLIDFSRSRDVGGKTLILKFHIGHALLLNPSDRDWFRSFFEAKFRWAVFGNFKDTANAANDNLCRCNPEEDEVEVSAERDVDGYFLFSDKVF